MVAAVSLAFLAGMTARADYPSAVLADGPLTYYRFNETGQVSMPYPLATNLGTVGAAGNGTDTTRVTPLALTRGVPGPLNDPSSKAMRFPGLQSPVQQDQHVHVDYKSEWNTSGPFSVECWAKPESAMFGGLMTSVDYGVSPHQGWVLYQSDSDINTGNGWVFRMWTAGNLTSIAAVNYSSIPVNIWYHLVGVFDGANAMLYVNGVQVTSVPLASTYTPNTKAELSIGARSDYSGHTDWDFLGSAAEAVYYTNALSAGEIAAHYAAATTNATGYAAQILANNPAGYWRLNEPFVQTFAKNSGSGGAAFDGTYKYLSATASDLEAPAYGGFETTNTVLQVGAPPNGYVSVPALNLNSATATFECWLKRNGDQAPYVGLLFDRNGGSSSGLEMYTNNMLSYHWNDAGGEFVSGLVVPDNQWTYTALAISPSRAVLYMYDGTTWSSATNNLRNAAASFNVPLYIGSDPSASSYNGRLDESAIYNKTLTAGQLRTHALAGFGATQAPVFVTDPPVQLTAGTIYAGWPFSLNVDAYGTPPLSFQWRKNGANLPDATNTTYSVTASAGGDSGNYDVIVTNPYGSTTNTATLAVTVVTTPPDYTTDLRTWLTFDETNGLTALDNSGHSRNGALQGFAGDNSQWVAGRITNAISVNPAWNGQVVLVPDDGGLNFATSQEFTLSAWVYVNVPVQNYHPDGAIIAKGTGNGGEQFCLEIDSGAFRFYVRDSGGNATVARTSVAPSGDWQHVCAVFSASSGVMKVYINGVQAISATPPSTLLASTHEVSIGARQSGSGAYDNDMVGRIDDARVYGRALLPAEVQALYNSAPHITPVFLTDPPVLLTQGTIYAGWPFSLNVQAFGIPPLTYQWRNNGTNILNATNTTYSVTTSAGSDSGNYDVVATDLYGSTTNATPVTVTVVTTPPDYATGLRTWLRFDETNGLTALDSSSHSRNGTLQGFADDNSQWVAGLITNAIAVNPNWDQQVVLVPDDGGLSFSSNLEFTLAAWVHIDPIVQNYRPNGGIIAKGNGGGGEQFCMDVDGGHFRFYVRDAAGGATVCGTAVSPDGNWQHVCAVYSASSGVMKLYINGVQAGGTTPPSSLLASSHDVSIGARQSGSGDAYDNDMIGLIDDARVFGRALVPAEVQALYNAAPTIAPSISQNPQGRSVFSGGTVSLSTVVVGTVPMKYQWYRGATAVPGATTPALTVASVTSATIGEYTLRATNGGGYIISDPATVALLPANANTYESLVVADAPEAYWRLNDASGATLDSMGRHDGSPSGGYFARGQTGALADNGDTCVQFDKGSQDLVTVPYSSNLNAVPFSIECWAQYTGPSPVDTYYAAVGCTDASNRGYVVYATPSTTWECWLGRGSDWSYGHALTLQPSAWAHLVATFDGTTAKIYKNGVLTQSSPAASFLPNLSQPFFIGCNLAYGAYYFTGFIDEVACYKSVLSPERVNAHYNLGWYGTNALPVFVPPPASQTVEAGATATFTATVIGAPTLSYQWQKDGVNIPGATGLTLSVTNVYYTDGGHQYALAATNAVGGAVSLPATLTVMPPASQTNLVLRTQAGSSGAVLELIWPAGTLYSAPAMTGPWTAVGDATLPYYTVSPTNATMFFRRE
jgi:hypothetical protein